MFERPEGIDFWLAAYAGEPVDWAGFFADFESTVDWPACDFVEPLMALYPDAPVVLTVRDPESWYKSVMNTLWQARQGWLAAGLGPESEGMRRLTDVMIWQGAMQGRFLDKEYAIAFFNRHIRHIKDLVPRDKLLVFDAKEGWEPLCGFLGVPAPDKPFPRLNDTAAFQEMMRQLQTIGSQDAEGRPE
jgi:hypothetical protein